MRSVLFLSLGILLGSLSLCFGSFIILEIALQAPIYLMQYLWVSLTFIITFLGIVLSCCLISFGLQPDEPKEKKE